MPERPRRPAPRADLTALVDALGGHVHMDRAELAAATAAAVVSAGRGPDAPADPQRLVSLADEVGLDTLAELWRDAEAGSLPWALWAVYLMRSWCRDQAADVSRLWRVGRGYAPADEVVAGVAEDGGPNEVAELADSILAGAYTGDFAVALERAAAFFRVIAEGRREGFVYAPDARDQLELADRNDRVADLLGVAADRARRGELH
ncbi:MAG: hypothetical protein ACR2KJ_05890 [Jatrophihabitans sp.]